LCAQYDVQLDNSSSHSWFNYFEEISIYILIELEGQRMDP